MATVFQRSCAPTRMKARVMIAAPSRKPNSVTASAKPMIQATISIVRRRTTATGISSSSAAADPAPKALSTAAAITAAPSSRCSSGGRGTGRSAGDGWTAASAAGSRWRRFFTANPTCNSASATDGMPIVQGNSRARNDQDWASQTIQTTMIRTMTLKTRSALLRSKVLLLHAPALRDALLDVGQDEERHGDDHDSEEDGPQHEAELVAAVGDEQVLLDQPAQHQPQHQRRAWPVEPDHHHADEARDDRDVHREEGIVLREAAEQHQQDDPR